MTKTANVLWEVHTDEQHSGRTPKEDHWPTTTPTAPSYLKQGITAMAPSNSSMHRQLTSGRAGGRVVRVSRCATTYEGKAPAKAAFSFRIHNLNLSISGAPRIISSLICIPEGSGNGRYAHSLPLNPPPFFPLFSFPSYISTRKKEGSIGFVGIRHHAYYTNMYIRTMSQIALPDAQSRKCEVISARRGVSTLCSSHSATTSIARS